MQRLSGDLAPFIADPHAVLALVRVASAKWTALPDPVTERGIVNLEAVEVFAGTGLKAGQKIEVAGMRLSDQQARFRNRLDQWNLLAFDSGDLLAVALEATREPGIWNALGALPAASTGDPLVAALRRACAIERMAANSEERLTSLEDALISPVNLLSRYALDVIGRRAQVTRSVGVGMLAKALSSSRLPAPSRIPLAQELTSRNFYRYELGSEPANVLVIGTLAHLLVNGAASERSIWTQMLAASVTIEFSKDPVKDRDLRLSLIRAVTDPAPRRVIETLQNSHDPRVPRIVEAWEAAHK